MDASPKNSRRWMRFSLSSFLVCVVLVGIGMGMWIRSREAIRYQWALVESLSANENYDFNILTSPASVPEWMLVGMPDGQRSNIQSLEFEWKSPNEFRNPIASVQAVADQRAAIQEATEQELEKICEVSGKLPMLETLRLRGCRLTDTHCQLLAQSKSLRGLDLSRNQELTPAGVTHLTKIESLENVDLSWGYEIGDPGIRELANMPNLRNVIADGIEFSWRTQLLFEDRGLNITGFRGCDIDITDESFSDVQRLKSPLVSVQIDTRSNSRSLTEIVQALTKWEILNLTTDLLSVEDFELLQSLNYMSVYAWIEGDRQAALESLHRIWARMQPQSNGITIVHHEKLLWVSFERSSPAKSMTFVFNYEPVGDTPTEPESLMFEDLKGLDLKSVSRIELKADDPNLYEILQQAKYAKTLDVSVQGVSWAKLNSTLGRLKKMKRLKLINVGMRERLPDDFFQDWSSSETLTYLQIGGLPKGQDCLEELPEIRQFKNLQRLRVENYYGNSLDRQKGLRVWPSAVKWTELINTKKGKTIDSQNSN